MGGGVVGVVGGGCVNGRDCCNQTTTSGTRAQAHAQAVFLLAELS